MSHRITIELPPSVLAYVESRAKEFGMTNEGWIESELEWQRQMSLETDWFFAERMYKAKPGAWREALAAIPHRPADPHDAKE